MTQYKLRQRKEFSVIRYYEPNFDKACEAAYRDALMIFGVDDDGHFTNVENSARSTDTLIIEFKSYRQVGSDYIYLFDAWVQRD